MPILDSGIVMRLPVAFPRSDEQQAILACVANQVEPFATTISHTEREIALLREYRTLLIADVVTGKLDVRGVAATLPDEADEPQTLIEAGLLDENEERSDDNVGNEVISLLAEAAHAPVVNIERGWYY